MGSITVDKFNIGMAIEVTYITPDNGRPTLNLRDRSNNIVLHVNPRWEERVLVLNTHIGGWGGEERPGGFDFSSGVPITVRVEAKPEHFVILVNGKVVHNYRHRLPVASVCGAEWGWKGTNKEAKLINLSVFY